MQSVSSSTTASLSNRASNAGDSKPLVERSWHGREREMVEQSQAMRSPSRAVPMIKLMPWWVVVLAATLGARTVVAQEARSAERLAARSGSAPGSSLACPARLFIEGVSLAGALTELHYRS